MGRDALQSAIGLRAGGADVERAVRLRCLRARQRRAVRENLHFRKGIDMTRKTAIAIERRLKADGVYKPYVSADNGHTYIESYPLNASMFEVFSTEEGPHWSITIYDASLGRLGRDQKIDHEFTRFGQDPLARAAVLLMTHHAEAYARAKSQDAACGV